MRAPNVNRGTFTLPRVPTVLGALAARLPQYPPSALLSLGLNLFARGVFPPDDAARLENKVIALCVRDAGLRLTLRITRAGYEACATSTPAEATVTADARDFLLLALGNVDPDTLFFDRRLLIEGDTEVGLLVKSALDRIPLPLPRGLIHLLKARLA
jgi:O2-independent ubiquinone biosynthesis accessory factor UbiT